MSFEDRIALRARLATEMAALRDDIAARQVEIDTTPGYVERAERRRAERGEVIFKVTESGGLNGGDLNGASAPLFSSDQMDVIAQAKADQKNDIADMVDGMLAPLRDRILSLEARVETVLALLGAGSAKSVAGGSRKRLPPPKGDAAT